MLAASLATVECCWLCWEPITVAEDRRSDGYGGLFHRRCVQANPEHARLLMEMAAGYAASGARRA